MSVGIDFSVPVRSQFCAMSRRHDALGARARWTIFAGLCTLSLGVALTLTAFGAWPVLPYSLLEMGLLWGAFRWFELHANDWERVTVSGDRIVVERMYGRMRTRRELNTFWTRLEVETDAGDRVTRLVLRHRGESLRFAEGLPHDQRTAVARELRRALAAAIAR